VVRKVTVEGEQGVDALQLDAEMIGDDRCGILRAVAPVLLDFHQGEQGQLVRLAPVARVKFFVHQVLHPGEIDRLGRLRRRHRGDPLRFGRLRHRLLLTLLIVAE
jgi:hypothetical protein